MKRFLFIIFICNAFAQLFAVPAYPYPVVFTQPNGEQITLIMKGDEFVRFAQTLDGYTLLYNAEGYFCYAKQNAYGDIEPSEFYAEEISNRNAITNDFLTRTPKELRYSVTQLSTYKQIRNIVEEEIENNNRNTIGVRKLLVILMEYPDKPFVKTQADFHDLFNQVKYTEYSANGSVKDFFFESSYNKLEVQATVVGPFTAQKNRAYYADNARELATEAVYAAKDAGVNFAEFATNGEVSSFYMIFAGCGQEAGAGTSAIWSHAWSITPVYFNGVKISTYACSPEHRGSSGTNITRIGVICHEFGHSLGAPDYYDTDYATNGQYDGTGTWDLQASGSWNDNGRTPAPPNPRSKVYIYGWTNAIILDSAQTVTIPSARIYENAYFRINTQTTNEYYIIENKIRAGFDGYIPGNDLLIYHCAANLGGMNTTSPQKFYPVAANAPVALPASGNNVQSHYGTINSQLCPWPGATGKTEFTDESIPAMMSWAGQPVEKPITNITKHGEYITFDFMGGNEKTNFQVLLPTYYGCTITPLPYSISPVNKGGFFSFVVNKIPSHSNSNIKVTANNIELTPFLENIYTISDIQSDQIVKIENLVFNTFNITATSDPNGTITPSGNISVNQGGISTFQFKPNNGYSVDEIFVDGISIGSQNSYTFRNITQPHTIHATFKTGGIYTINLSKDTIHFYTTEGVPSMSVAVTVSSPNVVANIAVAAPPKFQIFNNGSWTQSINMPKAELPRELYLRFNPANGDSGPFQDVLTLKSTEAYAEIRLIGHTNLKVNDWNNNRNIVIYPNPTIGELRITNYELRMGIPEIFDVIGRRQKAEGRRQNAGGELVIDISHLQSGIYFLKIDNHTFKIIKN